MRTKTHPQFRKLLNKFEQAAVDLAWQGSKTPQEAMRIELEYKKAKKALKDWVNTSRSRMEF